MIETEAMTLISNVGFPIAAFLLMWRTHTKTLSKLTDAVTELKLCMKEMKGG